MIIDAHCHAGLGDGLTGPWNTRAPLGDYLRRSRGSSPNLAARAKLSTSSSSSAAIALTCDLDRPTTPREAASFSTRRVETPSR
jgi:hypothetical protein